MKVQGGNASVMITAVRRPCSFLFGVSIVSEIKFTLSKYWRCSVTVMGATQLKAYAPKAVWRSVEIRVVVGVSSKLKAVVKIVENYEFF